MTTNDIPMDDKLIQTVYTETYKGHTITAMISRFGDLMVIAEPAGFDDDAMDVPTVYQGGNILHARMAIDRCIN